VAGHLFAVCACHELLGGAAEPPGRCADHADCAGEHSWGPLSLLLPQRRAAALLPMWERVQRDRPVLVDCERRGAIRRARRGQGSELAQPARLRRCTRASDHGGAMKPKTPLTRLIAAWLVVGLHVAAVLLFAWRQGRARATVVGYAVEHVPASRSVFEFRGAGFRNAKRASAPSDSSSVPQQDP